MHERPCHVQRPCMCAVRGRTPALCHVLSCSPCRRRSSAVPFLHIVPPSRSVPLHSVRAAAGLGAPSGGTVFARVSCVRACARPRASCAGAVRAPDCARETPDARLPFVPAGAFFGPSHCFPAQKSEKAAPGAAFSLPCILLQFLSSQAPGGRNMKIFLLCRHSGRRVSTGPGPPAAGTTPPGDPGSPLRFAPFRPGPRQKDRDAVRRSEPRFDRPLETRLKPGHAPRSQNLQKRLPWLVAIARVRDAQ